MLKDNDGKKTTPKKKAQDILMDNISLALGYWQEKMGFNIEDMTDREKELVSDQMEKIADRIAKICGYEEAWY